MIKEEPQLTIVMPLYNTKDFLNKAIESIINQTFNNFIFLISDNSSNDGSLEICKEYAKNDERIKVFKQSKNLGANKNIKFLIEKVNTAFVMVAASDDFLSSDWVEKLMNIQKKNYCISYGDTIFIDSFGDSRIHPSSLANQNNKGVYTYRRLNYFFKSSLEGKMLPFWGIYPTKIFKEIYIKDKRGLVRKNNTHALDTRIVFEALKYAEIYQDRTTFLFKRDHLNNDHKNPENYKKNKINFRFLNPLIAVFKIHAGIILWKDFSMKEKIFALLTGLPLYIKSCMISFYRICNYYGEKLKKIIKKS